MAGEQSYCGTSTRVAGETDALRERARTPWSPMSRFTAETVDEPSLPNARLARKGVEGRGGERGAAISFPVDNVGANLATLARSSPAISTISARSRVSGSTRSRCPGRSADALPCRRRASPERAGARVASGPLVGSIIKPNVGLSAYETAELVAGLCAAGLDFIKDDEICADPLHRPLAQRVPAVMAAVRRHQDRTGKAVMIAFNITDETDAMRRHARPRGARGRHLRDGEPELVRVLGHRDATALDRSRSARASQRLWRDLASSAARHLLPGLSDALAPRRCRPHACPWRAGEVRAGGRGGRLLGAGLRDAADRRRRRPGHAGPFSSGQWAGTAQPTFVRSAMPTSPRYGGRWHPRPSRRSAANGVAIRRPGRRWPAACRLRRRRSSAELKQALAFFGAAAG